jgi:cell wall-associated NlpC family hydrolase
MVTPAAHAETTATPQQNPVADGTTARTSAATTPADTTPASGTAVSAALAAAPVSAAVTTRAASWAVVGPPRTIYTGQKAWLNARTGAGAHRTTGMRLALHIRTPKGWFAGWIRRADQIGRAGFAVTPGTTAVYRVAVVGAGKVATGVSKPVTIAVSRGGMAIIAEAARHRGAPYVFGAAGPAAFDCSGFTQFVFRKFGTVLPHSATAQSRHGIAVAKAAAQPGDLVLFGGGGHYYHAAIYAGHGYMWDAATEGQPVARRKIYSQSYVVRRVI